MIKYILSTILVFFIILVILSLVDGILLNPYAGGEIHRILARHSSFWLETAFQVLIEYIIIVSILVCLLIIARYPCHWSIIATEGIVVVFLKWWDIRYFFFQQEEFSFITFCSIILIPVTIIFFAWLFRSKIKAK